MEKVGLVQWRVAGLVVGVRRDTERLGFLKMPVSPRMVTDKSHTVFKEETDMGFYLNVSDTLPQPGSTGFCPAKAMGPTQRQELARRALTKSAPISQLAAEHSVSRKFVSQQRDRADEAIRNVFEEESPEEEVLFHFAVTKDRIEQLILGLTLICHSSIRGVSELFRDVFDFPVSVGKIHEVLQRATTQARQDNASQDLSGVRIGATTRFSKAACRCWSGPMSIRPTAIC